MKKKIVTLLLIFAGISCGYAQMVTPFTPAQRGEDGKRVYVKPQTNYRRSSISIGYGYGSVTMIDRYANKLAESVNVLNFEKKGELKTRTGTFSVSYGHEFTPWLEIDFPVLISVAQGEFASGVISPDAQPPYLYDDLWITFMPSVRINWLRNEWFSFYTKAGVGFSMMSRWETDNKDYRNKVALAWQVSPVGVEFGKNWFNFFMEGGYGYAGYVHAGIKFKFGDGPKAAARAAEGRDWSQRYIP